MYALDDRHDTAFTPYRLNSSSGSEGALRYFLDLVYGNGWLQEWGENEREAFAQETLDELHDLSLSPEVLAGIREGSLPKEDVLKAVFEFTYGDSALWGDAQNSWFAREKTRFGIR